MKTRSIVIGAALLMAAAAGGFGVYRIGVNEGMKVAASPASTGGAAIAGAQKDVSGARKILYWHDPMVPGQKFDQPGKSPFMDMDLVPVYADDATDPGSTRIAASIQQNLGVRTAVVTRGRIGTVLTAAGSVAWNDRDVALVQARTSGFVERLHVRAPLDPVRSGQPLVDLYVPEWVAAQEEFFSVRRMQGRGLESLVDSARQRMRLAGMSDEQIRLVETGLRGVWRDPERYLDTYWRRFPGVWTHGDWASIDEDGYWFLHGRSDDTLNIAGKRIGPAELESAAIGSGVVAEAAAVGVPHEVKGEVAWIFCVAKPGAEAADATVADAVVGVLGKAFRPERIVWVDALPKTRSAKIVRRAVRARVLGKDPGDLSSLENPESLEAIGRAIG